MLSPDKDTVGLFPDLSASVLYQEFLLEGKTFLTGKKHGMFPRPQEESDFQSHTDTVPGTTPDISTGIFSAIVLQKYLAK